MVSFSNIPKYFYFYFSLFILILSFFSISTFYYEHGTFIWAKFNSYILAVYSL